MAEGRNFKSVTHVPARLLPMSQVYTLSRYYERFASVHAIS